MENKDKEILLKILSIVWDTIKEDLPKLRDEIKNIL